MKLNILGKSLLAAGMLALVACSDDLTINNGENTIPGGDGDGYYMSINIQLPTSKGGQFAPGATRSETTTNGQSTDGTEDGFPEENSVDNVLIVLANSTDNSFITAGTVASSKLNPIPSQNVYRPIAKLAKTNLSEFYKKYPTIRTVNVFVFCNPTVDLQNLIKNTNLGNTTWYDATCKVEEGNGQTEKNTGIWANNGFLMSNTEICTRELPATIDEWNKYNTESTAFDLSGLNSAGQDGEVDNSAVKNRGTVKVERNVARFDFRDGSKLGNNTYNVIYTLDEDGKQVPLINVQLDRMLLSNEAKEFYYLPRVSNDGLPTGTGFALCGSETLTNYVVGPYATVFQNTLNSNFGQYFNYPFFASNGESNYKQWSGKYIKDVLVDAQKDNMGTNQLTDQYYKWRYVTENVIPADNDNQTMGRTTMVVFKGRMVAAAAAFTSEDENTKKMAEAIGDGTDAHPCKLTGIPTQDRVIYYFNNTVYFGWENIKKAAIQSALQFDSNGVPTKDEDGNLTGIRRSSSLYLAVFGDGCMGKFVWGTTEYNDSPDGMDIDEKSTNYLYDQYMASMSDVARAAFKAAVVKQMITIYESSTDDVDGPGYYFYYYYKNRHNDNNDNGSMGAMEFATVRNNIYKLAVTNISSLGHPRIPENDPDKPTPDTPDESDDLYITVNCRVIPWVVRVNDIEF